MRKTNLARLLTRRPDGIFVAPFEQGEIGPDLFRKACEFGLEGLVSKHRDRAYRAGKSPSWLKVKNPKHPAMPRVKRRSIPTPGRDADDIAETVLGYLTQGNSNSSVRKNMEIAKALWQLSYAMLIFAGYLLFMVFVAPFGFGFAALVSAWNSFRGRSYLSAAMAVFTGNLSGGVRIRHMDRCSLVDFRKPHSIPSGAISVTIA